MYLVFFYLARAKLVKRDDFLLRDPLIKLNANMKILIPMKITTDVGTFTSEVVFIYIISTAIDTLDIFTGKTSKQN